MAPTTTVTSNEKDNINESDGGVRPLFKRCPSQLYLEQLQYYREPEDLILSVHPEKKYLFTMSVSVAQRQYFFPSFTVRGMDGLRRKESSGKTDEFTCPANARDIEIDITSNTDQQFEIAIQTPQGEMGYLSFNENGMSEKFTPETRTCGHGVWTIQVYKTLETGREEVSRTEVELNGVGTLFYRIDEDFEITLHDTNFLKSKGHCPLAH